MKKLLLVILILMNIVFSYADTYLTIKQGNADSIEDVDVMVDIYKISEYDSNGTTDDKCDMIQSELNKIFNTNIVPIDTKQMKNGEVKFNVDSGPYLVVTRGISNNPNDYIDIIDGNITTKIIGKYIYHYTPSLVFVSENQDIILKPSQSAKYEQNKTIYKTECNIINKPNKTPIKTDDNFTPIILCFIISIVLFKISRRKY